MPFRSAVLAGTVLALGLAASAAFAQALISQPALPLLNGAPAAPPPAIPPLQWPSPAADAARAPGTAPSAVPARTSAVPVSMSHPAGRGVAILLDQANYWSAQGRPDLARQALQRLLLVEPNNPDILATAAEMSALNGDRPAATDYVARLSAVAPGTPALSRAVAALRVATVDQAALSEARRLAGAGQREAAFGRYRDLFPNGAVPDVYAAEYYLALSGLSLQGFLEARAALEAVVARNPEKRPIQLSYAQMLTARETTRAEGIERLRDLARFPDVAGSARAAWRQALLWQGANGETFAQVEEYLRAFPPDPEILAKLEEARPAVQDPMAAVRMQAFDIIRRDPAEAERLFDRALAANAEDVDAMVGLGMIRRAQGRQAEARRYLDRVTELVPDRRDDFLRTMGYVSPEGVPYPAAGSTGARGSRGTGSGGARPRGGTTGPAGPSALAWRALEANRLDEAEALAQRAARAGAAEGADAPHILGLVALRRGSFGIAEGHLREALDRHPGQRDIQAALYSALVAQGRDDEADRFAARTGLQPERNAQGSRSNALRDRALHTADAEARATLLRAALAADPGNVWAAHDLARLLKTRGQADEARRIEGQLAGRGTADALYAAALLAEYDGRPGETVQRLEAIPARSRSPEAAALIERGRRVLELRRLEVAARGDPHAPAAWRLVALAGLPDPAGSTRAEVIRILSRLRQPENLEAARRAADPDSPLTSPEARAAIAAALLDADRRDEAGRLADRAARSPRLAEDLRRTVSAARVPVPARGAAEAGGPALPEAESWPAQLALARVYARSGRGEEASDLAEGVLRQAPDNVAARSVAGEVAVVRGQIGRAEALLTEGRARRADALQMELLEARIARAREDAPRARRALEEAARLRVEQLRAAGP